MIPKPEPRARTKARLKRLAKQHRADVMRGVDLRDGIICRVCGITTSPYDLPRQPNRHHIRYRSHGGEDSLQNIILLCALCHDRVHRSGVLRISGESDRLIVERYTNGAWANDNNGQDDKLPQ